MKEFYEERLELLKSGEAFVLASIFYSQGSAPRTTGVRMIIRFNKVHKPIGLQIGSETPEEIAVSIAAELIKVRRERMI